jgi:hypothetical protein
MNFVGQPDFFEHDGNLPAIGRRPGVEIDHGCLPSVGFTLFVADLPVEAQPGIELRTLLTRGRFDIFLSKLGHFSSSDPLVYG